jgi:hypothetical protein
MAFAASIGFGGKLEVETGVLGSDTWKEVGQIVDAGLNVNAGEVDVSHQQSPNEDLGDPGTRYWDEYISGAIDLEFPFTAVFDPGGEEHEDSVLDFIGVVRNFRYEFGQGQKWTFAGFYRSHTFGMPNENRLELDCTIRVTGTPVFDATWV